MSAGNSGAGGVTGTGDRARAGAAGDHTFACEDEARAALVAACRAMNTLGINQGRAGNASLRWDRGAAAGFLVTPSAFGYDRMVPDDIVWMSIDLAASPRGDPAARIVDGARAPSTEWRMHRELHATRADARAVVHTHSVHATALACLPAIQSDGIPAFHYMVAVAGGADIRCARYATFGTEQLARNALAALDGRRGCLLANHGVLVCHAGLDAALALAVEIETLARMYAQVLALGAPALLDAAEMARVLERFRTYG